jgi:hypothetical protein
MASCVEILITLNADLLQRDRYILFRKARVCDSLVGLKCGFVLGICSGCEMLYFAGVANLPCMLHRNGAMFHALSC